jgi:putative copper resistance protein D
VNPDLLAALLRGLGFLGLFQATGATLFAALLRIESPAAHAALRRLILVAAIAALLCFILQQTLEAARFAGEFLGVFDPGMQQIAWRSSAGFAQAVRIGGLLLLIVGVAGGSGTGWRVATLGALCALLSFALTGHTSHHALRIALAPLLALHLLVAAFWFGSLAPLYLLSNERSREHAVPLLRRFSRIAGRLVPLIAVAGVVMAVMLLPNLAALREPYGILLLVKLALFAALMALAAYNKWRLIPALERGEVGAFAVLRRTIASEVVLIAGALLVTSVLTLFFSPE